MNVFEVGKRYKVHDSTQGMLVVGKQDDKLIINIDGVEMAKSILTWNETELVGTGAWHFSFAYKIVEELE